VPGVVIRTKCAPYCQQGRARPRLERINESVYDIVVRYQLEYRGLVEYYRLAYNLHQLGRLKAVMQESLAKTVAAKLQISVVKVYGRYGTLQQTTGGPRRVLKVSVERQGKRPLVALWGGIPLVRKEEVPLPAPSPPVREPRATLTLRLLANSCELCSSHEGVQVHFERRLKDLCRDGAAGTDWAEVMLKRHRKSLVVCEACHQRIHAGRPRRRSRP
jgi:hypothetical protein